MNYQIIVLLISSHNWQQQQYLIDSRYQNRKLPFGIQSDLKFNREFMHKLRFNLFMLF